MHIEPFCKHDIDDFLAMADREGWVADAWEFNFLLDVFPGGCFCVRGDSGKGLAFVTAIRHDRSGWIGNLIVAEEERRKGIGEELFKRALSALHASGAETVWLTASVSGKSLYEKHGFQSVDTILRWSGHGRQQPISCVCCPEYAVSSYSVSGLDLKAWGDRRDTLLSRVTDRGKLFLEESGFLVIQPCGADMQLGPFTALDASSADQLLDKALAAIPYNTKICIDAPASNAAAVQLYNRKGMRVRGGTELMYSGKKPAFETELLYGLASMGSMG